MIEPSAPELTDLTARAAGGSDADLQAADRRTRVPSQRELAVIGRPVLVAGIGQAACFGVGRRVGFVLVGWIEAIDAQRVRHFGTFSLSDLAVR